MSKIRIFLEIFGFIVIDLPPLLVSKYVDWLMNQLEKLSNDLEKPLVLFGFGLFSSLILMALLPLLFLLPLAQGLKLLTDMLIGINWIGVKVPLSCKTNSKGEDWAIALGWFIPRKYRFVIGDIIEDCAEMREYGYTERRIKLNVVYQWLIALVTLVPMAAKTSIADILKQVLGP